MKTKLLILSYIAIAIGIILLVISIPFNGFELYSHSLF